jgi:hypothetical protein
MLLLVMLCLAHKIPDRLGRSHRASIPVAPIAERRHMCTWLDRLRGAGPPAITGTLDTRKSSARVQSTSREPSSSTESVQQQSLNGGWRDGGRMTRSCRGDRLLPTHFCRSTTSDTCHSPFNESAINRRSLGPPGVPPLHDHADLPGNELLLPVPMVFAA